MAKSREINMNLPSVDDLFTTQEERDQKNQEYVKDISIYEITDFPNHPFKVKMDDKMLETIESVRDLIAISKKVAADETALDKNPESMSKKELEKHIADIEKKMKKAAAELNFEAAAEYRDKLIMLKNTLRDIR